MAADVKFTVPNSQPQSTGSWTDALIDAMVTDDEDCITPALPSGDSYEITVPDRIASALREQLTSRGLTWEEEEL
jgi:hypothetical protein